MNLLQLAFETHNLVFTIFLCLMLVYWLLVMIGGLDLEFIDFGLESDVDVDAEVEGSTLSGIFRFFNLSELPTTIVLSVLAICTWIIALYSNHMLNPEGWWLLAIGLGLGNVIISLFLTKFITAPMVSVYKRYFNTAEIAIDFLGRDGQLLSPIQADKIGQMEVIVKGDPIKIYVKALEGRNIPAQTEVTVINESKDGKYYYVEAKFSLNNI